MAPTTQAPIWATSASVFQHCSIFQTDHYMWSTVCVIVFIHPHMPNKQSCGAGNVLENHQMLCRSATVFVTGVWFVEHLFSRLASVFLSLRESFLLCAASLPTPSRDYSHPATILQKLILESLHGCFKVAEAAQRCRWSANSNLVLCTKTDSVQDVPNMKEWHD